MEKSDTFEIFASQFAEKPEILESAIIGLGKLLRMIAKLNDEGILDVINKAIEDEKIIKMKDNVPILINFILSLSEALTKIDQKIIAEYIEKLPKALNSALVELKKEQKGIGFWELMNIAKKPEFAALIKSLEALLKNLK